METESDINKGTDAQSQTFINTARHQSKIQNVSPVARLCFQITGYMFVHCKLQDLFFLFNLPRILKKNWFISTNITSKLHSWKHWWEKTDYIKDITDYK